MLVVFISVLLISGFLHTAHGSSLHSPDRHLKFGGHALNALQRLLNFFESNADNLNLDGLYGLRIAEGQLHALEQLLASSADSHVHLTDRHNIIQTLSQQIERVANTSLNTIAREQAPYLHRFSLVASQPFFIEYQTRRINRDLIERDQRISRFDEEESDQCFAELLGSSDRPDAGKCFISQPCWEMMTSRVGKDYRLTHQLLWFLIAKSIGCINKRVANKNLNQLEDHFCANIYEDAQVNLKNNINQDLFLEQLLLCSMAGYEDFLRLDWFQTILTWQHPEYNCFSDASETVRFHRQHKRHLLIEQEMNHGCLSHKSGLAAGLLATYSRAFLQKQ